MLYAYCNRYERDKGRVEPPRPHRGEEEEEEEEATLFENLWWKSWTNVRVSSSIIYDPLQLCKYQCWATFLTANDGPSFSIIMTDQRWIIHLRALKYAITLELLRIHLSRRFNDLHWKGGAFISKTVSDRKLWTHVLCCCCCLFWRSETKIWCSTGKQQRGRKASHVLPHWRVFSVDLWPRQRGGENEHFPKHNQSILKQRKIAPQRKSNVRVS